jgi:hypothetical protein
MPAQLHPHLDTVVVSGLMTARIDSLYSQLLARGGVTGLLSTDRVWRTVVGDQFAAAIVNHCSSRSPTVVEVATLGPRPTLSTIAASSRSASILLPRTVLDR